MLLILPLVNFNSFVEFQGGKMKEKEMISSY